MPIRACEKSTGPPSSRLISQAMIGNSQQVRSSSNAEPKRSKRRLTTWLKPSSGIWVRLMSGSPSRSSMPARIT